MRILFVAVVIGIAVSASQGLAQPRATLRGQYKVINTAKVGGAGGFDYVFADTDGRKLYVPRGNRVTVFDLDTLKSAGRSPTPTACTEPRSTRNRITASAAASPW